MGLRLLTQPVAFHGSEFMGERLVVQFARGNQARPGRDGYHDAPRMAPRPRRTIHRMTITGLPFETSWQDLKDFARQSGLDVVYSEVTRERDANGNGKGFVEYETAADLANAVEKLDNHDFKGSTVRCISDVNKSPPNLLPARRSHTYSLQPQTDIPRPRERYRSRSPGGYRGRGGYGPPPMDDYYDRRGPPRGYSPRRDDYRRRTPPPRGYYDDPREDRYGPPRRGPPPPIDDYPPPRRGGGYPPDDRGYAPPPQRAYPDDPYLNGHGREPYGRPPSPRRDGRAYERGGYDARPYW
ncbi:hypothetical protein EJ03DRAFT_177979 [Teratosphaeria nubilosa]|uniref:RRM domain-containing protein n=1 Tax=Teratosphaeria nubilosa TaxID=161662 RepID=A0A6G1L209_9PEZI|nr:hypothetical protein EJ03DRAFT_177979 [Teratosphaeria nubilosa]